MNNVKIEYNEMRYLMDKKLSLKAKGVMALMIAYINKNNRQPTFSLEQVRPFCCDGVVAFNNAVKELEHLGYFEKTIGKNGFGGTGGSPWSYILRE